jgi:L-alanine-DL-glutamate epimerase-like enolase superfamily enzyme
MKPTDIAIREVKTYRVKFNYRAPVKFGGREVKDVVVLRARVVVESRGTGKLTVGYGEMTLGNAWAWPSKKLNSSLTSLPLIGLFEKIAAQTSTYSEYGHPLRLTYELSKGHSALAEDIAQVMKLPESIPALAVLLAASPIEAAIHDAYGKSLGLSSFNCLGEEFCSEDLSFYLGAEFAGLYLDRFTSRAPKAMMPLYHLVGASDPLGKDDVKRKIGDGLPETLDEWIQVEGLSHLKIKLDGDDLDWDVGRVTEVDRICNRIAPERVWRYSVDFNERCPNEDYVIEFLERIDRLSKTSFPRIQYIEQPTSRDLVPVAEQTMHRVSRSKPVVLDEGLLDLETMQRARQMGYNGVALKACKGQTESLLMAAAAQHYGLFLCVQDLTCIGGSFLHSASLAARIPTVAAIEGNGRQYCPEGNLPWLDEYGPMFKIRSGSVPTELLAGPGLGYHWPSTALKGLEPE